MVKTNKLFGKTLSLLLSLAVVLAICASFVTAFAEEAKTFEQTLEIGQTVEGKAGRTRYTYRLTPKSDNCPLPEDAKNGVYEFVLDGNDFTKLLMAFPAEVAADYQYELTRLETVPAGDTVTPVSHLFGYLVEQKEDGSWIITPYTCYDGHMEIWKKTDASGNPLGITLANMIKGAKESSSSTTTTTNKNSSQSTTRTNYSTRTVTTTRGGVVSRVVNTGDPYQVGLWVVLIVLSLAALIIVAAVRRKKEKDDEEI